VRLIVVAVFAGGAMLAGVIARCAERCGARRHKPTVLATLALEIAIVAALCIAGRLMEPALARASRASRRIEPGSPAWPPQATLRLESDRAKSASAWKRVAASAAVESHSPTSPLSSIDREAALIGCTLTRA
jgi:hypothetical protein